MSSNPCIQAVVETPCYEGEPLWPWSVADYKPFLHIQLYDEMIDKFDNALLFHVNGQSNIGIRFDF